METSALLLAHLISIIIVILLASSCDNQLIGKQAQSNLIRSTNVWQKYQNEQKQQLNYKETEAFDQKLVLFRPEDVANESASTYETHTLRSTKLATSCNSSTLPSTQPKYEHPERGRTKKRWILSESLQPPDEDLGGFIEVSPEVQTHLTNERLLNSKVDLFSSIKQQTNGTSKLSKLEISPSNRDPMTTSNSQTRGKLDKGEMENVEDDGDHPIDEKDRKQRQPAGGQIEAEGFIAQQQSELLKQPGALNTRKLLEMRRTSAIGPGGAIYSGLRLPAIADAPRGSHRAPPIGVATTSQPPPLVSGQNGDGYINQLYLDSSMPLEVQAHVGSTAYLVCRLRSIQQQEHLQVSWVRNMQILTSGELRYTSDERFRPTHSAGSHDWALEIHNVNANDEGAYECQVNSEPKAASVSLYLGVIAATIEIMEQSPMVVADEEQIRLTCRVEFNSQQASPSQPEAVGEEMEPAADEDPTQLALDSAQLLSTTQKLRLGDNKQGITKINRKQTNTGGGNGKVSVALSSQHYIYWYKDDITLQFNNPRGGIRVERHDSPSRLESVLIIDGAVASDSGIYLCKLLPELNEVAPAECQVIVGGSSSGRSNSFGISNGSCDKTKPMNGTTGYCMPLTVAILMSLYLATLVPCIINELETKPQIIT